MKPHSFALTAANSALLVIDMQERFQMVMPSISAEGQVGKNTKILIESARALGVPALTSEQYPKGLGSTLPFLSDVLAEQPRLPKTHFSCCDDATLAAKIHDLERPWWVICGVETHVCVLATVADLLQLGHHVVIAGDAVDSRKESSRILALQAARDLGALVVPAESIVFRWLRNAQGDTFKRISALVIFPPKS